MLKLKPEIPETVTETIEITIPGQEKPGKFTPTFRYRNKADFMEFMKILKGKEDVDIVMEILTGWKDIDAEFSRENVSTFLEHYPMAAVEIIEAYGSVLFRSRVKN